MNKSHTLYDRSLDFAVRIVALYRYLQQDKKEFVISNQIMRSGTSIGANIAEAKGAQSDQDFIAKLHISLKEAFETGFWIRLLLRTGILSESEALSLLNDINSLIALLTSSIKTVKLRANHS